MRVLENITYVERQGQTLALDLYLPQGVPKAIVLYAHGGGFIKGHRNGPEVAPIAGRLTGNGYAVASLSYRFKTSLEAFEKPERKAIKENRSASRDAGLALNNRLIGPAFEAARRDLESAIGFLKTAEDLHGMARPLIVALGTSAGGIAALALAYPSAHSPAKHRPCAVVTLGAGLIHPWALSAKGPPCLMIHSHFDKIIPPSDAEIAAQAARQAGAPVALMTCARPGHNAPVAALLSDSDADGTPYWDHMLACFEAGQINPKPANV